MIFVANHASHLDTPLILLSLPDEWRRRTAVAAAADYFFDTWWRAVGSAMVFNTFPIDRRGGTMATTPGDLLDEGWSLVIYPEGTRSKDGWVGRFQLGAAYLATRHGVPVVPIAHRGTFAAMPRGQNWPSRGRRQLTLRFGEPLCPGEASRPREFAPRIRSAVGALLDEERTTWWEAQQRAARDATPDPSGPDIAPWRRVWEQTATLTAPSPTGRRLRAWRASRSGELRHRSRLRRSTGPRSPLVRNAARAASITTRSGSPLAAATRATSSYSGVAVTTSPSSRASLTRTCSP